MDVGAFVQENRRWLLGCAIGLVVFFIARGVIGSIYDADSVRREARKVVQAVQGTATYDSTGLAAAAAEQTKLEEERRALEAELAYVSDAAFQLEGKALSPDEYLGKVGRERKLAILKAASERDVQALDKDLTWPPAQGPDEIRSVLFGIELLDAAARRLFDAHDAVRKADPQAQGLVSLRLIVDARRAQRASVRPGKPGEVDVREFLDQERVTFEFRSDEATMLLFLESLRQPGKALTLEPGLKIVPSPRRGEAMTVSGSLIGIAFKKKGE